jgi:hypothetical protein
MRVIHNPMKITLTSMLTLIAFAINSCSPIEMKKVVVQRGAHYKFSTQQSGLRISVDPYTENDRLQNTFGCDVLSRGILPVLLVVENISSEDGYIVVNDTACLITADPINNIEQSDEVQKSEKLGRAGNRLASTSTAAVATAHMLPVIGVASLVLLPFALGGEATYRDEIEIQRNLKQKQILPKTIYQGSLQSGFLYFNLGKAEYLSKLQGVSLSMRNVRTNELLSVTISMGKF